MSGLFIINRPFIEICSAPNGSVETMGLYGEQVYIERVVDEEWADGYWCDPLGQYPYPGFFRTESLIEVVRVSPATHLVDRPVVVVYDDPDFKKPLHGRELYFNSRVFCGERAMTRMGAMVWTPAGWVYEEQLRPLGRPRPDYVETMRLFLGSAYSWGARAGTYDCSGVTHAALLAAGEPCPRDCFPQAKCLGEQMPFIEHSHELQYGDFVFWTMQQGRHVAVMTGPENCIHTTLLPSVGGCIEQPLAALIDAQLEKGNGAPTIIGRIPGYSFV